MGTYSFRKMLDLVQIELVEVVARRNETEKRVYRPEFEVYCFGPNADQFSRLLRRNSADRLRILTNTLANTGGRRDRGTTLWYEEKWSKRGEK